MNKEQKAAKKAAKKNKRRKAYVAAKTQSKLSRARFIKMIKAQRRMNIARGLARLANTKVEAKPETSDGSDVKLDDKESVSNK